MKTAAHIVVNAAYAVRMPEENLPERQLRASDADRDAIAERLREALAEGRLTDAEHSDRLDHLYAARTYGELDQVTADLPLPSNALVPRRSSRPSAPAENVPVQFAVFSSTTVRPTGMVRGTTVGFALFGGTTIDLRNAEIAESGMDVTALAIFGAVEIIVPIDANVKVLGIPLFGGVHHEKDELVGDGPLVNIRAVVLFGGINIKRKPPRLPKASKPKKRDHDDPEDA